MITFIFLVVVGVTAVWAEYKLAMRFGIIFSIASVCGLLAIVAALLRAPEGGRRLVANAKGVLATHLGATARTAKLATDLKSNALREVKCGNSFAAKKSRDDDC